MVDSTFDVIVVGAGPAGLLASEILAAQGVTVAVIEKNLVPGKAKPCGGFLTQKGMEVGKIPLDLAERIITGVSLSMPDFPVNHVDYSHFVGIQLTREALGHHLCQRAEKAGANIFFEHHAINCLQEDSGWRIILKGKINELQAPLLIGTDGVNSTVARSTGIRTRFRKDQLGLTVQAQIALPEEEISSRFGHRMDLFYGREICPYGYLWIFPKRESVYVGVGSLLSAVTDRLEHYLHTFIENHSIGKNKLDGGTIRLIERALVPLTYERQSAADGVLLAGDAAGHCNAITGEGLQYALMAGKIAGEIAGDALKKGDMSIRYLRRYENRWNQVFGSDLKWGLRLRNFFYRSMASKYMSTGMASNQRFLKLAADIIVGVRPLRDTLIRAIPHYIWQRFKTAFFS